MSQIFANRNITGTSICVFLVKTWDYVDPLLLSWSSFKQIIFLQTGRKSPAFSTFLCKFVFLKIIRSLLQAVLTWCLSRFAESRQWHLVAQLQNFALWSFFVKIRFSFIFLQALILSFWRPFSLYLLLAYKVELAEFLFLRKRWKEGRLSINAIAKGQILIHDLRFLFSIENMINWGHDRPQVAFLRLFRRNYYTWPTIVFMLSFFSSLRDDYFFKAYSFGVKTFGFDVSDGIFFSNGKCIMILQLNLFYFVFLHFKWTSY